MDRKLKIAVIFGGCSSEYPVSLESAHSVIVNLDRDKYELVLLGITKGGEWFRYYGGPEALEDDSWSADRSKCVPAVISPDRDLHGIVEFRMNGRAHDEAGRGLSRAARALWRGRHRPGPRKLAGIPVIGCGTLASALCMDKDRATSWPRSPGWTCRGPSPSPACHLTPSWSGSRRSWPCRCS